MLPGDAVGLPPGEVCSPLLPPPPPQAVLCCLCLCDVFLFFSCLFVPSSSPKLGIADTVLMLTDFPLTFEGGNCVLFVRQLASRLLRAPHFREFSHYYAFRILLT